MAWLVVRHKVEDYSNFKTVFDEHGSMRRDNGSKGGMVFRGVDDPNEVLVVLEWDSVENARQFTESDDLRAAMQRAGVVDQPDIYFTEEADRPSV